MKFSEKITQYPWQEVREKFTSYTSGDVEQALSRSGNGTLEDFAALISPASDPYLEEMARQAQTLTRKRFGNTILLYIPLYLSNTCNNICTYCGFSLDRDYPRKVLSEEEIEKEFLEVRKWGFGHILLLTGEDSRHAGPDFIKKAVQRADKLFSNVALEVQPLETEEYVEMVAAGLDTLYIYQETYDSDLYPRVHPKGKKKNYTYRLDTPERAGEAGVDKIGIGSLLGLSEPLPELFYTALHAQHLKERFWKTRLSISFPRMRDAYGVEQPLVKVDEKMLLKAILAFRLWDENMELSLSTRESSVFRDNAFSLGVTSMSAGSSTSPGGYAGNGDEIPQFEITDERSPQEVAEFLINHGFDPVWKDWDRSMG